MQSRFQQGYITDLVCPPPPPGKTAADVVQMGHELAMSMCSSAQTMSQLNPFVTDVSTLDPSDPKAVDTAALAAAFGVEVNAEYATSQFTQYSITDKLPVVAGYSTTLVYYSAIRTTRDGLEALTNPGNGVTIHGRWVISVGGGGGAHDRNGESTEKLTSVSTSSSLSSSSPPNDDAFSLGNSSGIVHLLETQDTRCNVLLSWYIKQSVDKSHRTTHRRFKEIWRERMKEMLYPGHVVK
jgi:hypothetical protein